MTQLTVSDTHRRPRTGRPGGLVALVRERVGAARRNIDLIDVGVSLWLALWAGCVSASLYLLFHH